MRVIKNFFHNINDILLALIIVVIAAGIIYWRMGIILDYPRQLAEQQVVYEDGTGETAEEPVAEEPAAEEAPAEEPAAEETAATEEPQG